MSTPRIVIVIGDGQLQKVMSDTPDVNILVLDADLDDEGTEFIGGRRYWAGLLEPEIRPETIAEMFEEHMNNLDPWES